MVRSRGDDDGGPVSLSLSQVLSLNVVLREDGGGGAWLKWGAVGCLFVGPAGTAVSTLLMNTLSQRVAIRMRGALLALLYRKGARLDLAAADYRLGEVVSIMSSDINNVVAAITYIHLTWSPVAQATITLVLLSRVIGTSVVGAFLFMAFALPFNSFLFKKIYTLTRAFMKARDHRLELLTEVLQSVRVIKMMAFERQFIAAIAKRRAAELEVLKWIQVVLTVAIAFIISMPSMIGVAVSRRRLPRLRARGPAHTTVIRSSSRSRTKDAPTPLLTRHTRVIDVSSPRRRRSSSCARRVGHVLVVKRSDPYVHHVISRHAGLPLPRARLRPPDGRRDRVHDARAPRLAARRALPASHDGEHGQSRLSSSRRAPSRRSLARRLRSYVLGGCVRFWGWFSGWVCRLCSSLTQCPHRAPPSSPRCGRS